MTQPLTTNSPSGSVDTQEVDGACEVHGPCKFVVFPEMFAGSKPLRMKRCEGCAADRKAREDAERDREEVRRRDAQLHELRSQSLIPARFRDRSLANYIATTPGQTRALQVCNRFVDNWPEGRRNGTSLIFTGGPGTGKTHLACGIASALIERYESAAMFMTTLQAMRSIKASYNRDAEITEEEAVDNLRWPQLLILDEIGVQVGSEHEKLLLFDVLNSRYQDCRSTILLSNLSMVDLETYLGQRVMDRYRECGAVIAFDWDSHRGRR